MDLHFQPWKCRPGCGFTCPWMGRGEPSARTRGQWGMMTMRRSQRRWAASSVQLLAAEPAPGICVCFGCMRCAGMAILQCSERKEGRKERACEFPNMTLCLGHVEPCRAVPGMGRCRVLAWGGSLIEHLMGCCCCPHWKASAKACCSLFLKPHYFSCGKKRLQIWNFQIFRYENYFFLCLFSVPMAYILLHPFSSLFCLTKQEN